MKLDKILIVHPSRGRPEMARMHSQLLMQNRTSACEFRYVFSLDQDDPSCLAYSDSLKRCEFPYEVLLAPNKGVIEAVNRAASSIVNEDVIINMSDDIASTSGWDSRLSAFVSTINPPMYLVQPVDMDNGESIPVVQIMSSALHHRLGYILPPCYDTMYADNDLIESCRLLGAVFPCRGLGFDHRHPNYGKGQWDETYARENRPEAYASGAAMLERRRADTYGLKNSPPLS
jgi:hypothetical protein